MKLPHLSKFWHGVSQVGLTALSVATIAGKFAPPPFNIAIVGGATLAQALLALHHHQASPTVAQILDLPQGKPPMSVR